MSLSPADSSPGLLLIRADAGPEIGIGHVMRCLALAQAWQDAGGTVAFASAELPGELHRRLSDENCAVHSVRGPAGGGADLDQTRRLAASLGAEWLVLDGYRFGGDFPSGVRDAAWRVLMIDDDARHAAYQADVILNQNIGASAAQYAGKSANSRLLLGSTYAMLRREFRTMPRAAHARHESVARILITFGGADPASLTRRVAEACLRAASPACVIDVVVGPANRDGAALKELVQAQGGRVVLHHSPANLPELMSRCDFAISAAGSSLYEFGFLGVPLLVIVAADNQAPSAQTLDQIGAAVRVDEAIVQSESRFAATIGAFAGDETRRNRCAEKFSALIDGQGAPRVAAALQRG